MSALISWKDIDLLDEACFGFCEGDITNRRSRSYVEAEDPRIEFQFDEANVFWRWLIGTIVDGGLPSAPYRLHYSPSERTLAALLSWER